MQCNAAAVKLASSRAPAQRWSLEEDDRLTRAVEMFEEKNWRRISAVVGSKKAVQCMQRWKRSLRPDLKKGRWTHEEDALLIELITQGCKTWPELSNRITGRSAKQCRERWTHHLDPAVNKDVFTLKEDWFIISTQAAVGNRWSHIAAMLPGRTENAVKVRWKTCHR
ncbi:Homeodomain-like protein, partial [Tribonema minus]